jgi:hypothetical protein
MNTTRSKVREPKLADGAVVLGELTAAELEEVTGGGVSRGGSDMQPWTTTHQK